MELLGESLRGPSLAGLVDTEQPHLIGEVFHLIEHHEHLPGERLYWGVGMARVGVRSWLKKEIRQRVFPKSAGVGEKEHGFLKYPSLFCSEAKAVAIAWYRSDGLERGV